MNRSHLDKLSESYAQIAEGKKSEEEVKDWNRKDDNPQGKKVDKKKVDKCTCESFYLKRLHAMNPVYAEQYRAIAEVLIGEGYESARLLDNIIEALPMDVVGPEFVSAMKAVNPRIHENLETAEKRQARSVLREFDLMQKLRDLGRGMTNFSQGLPRGQSVSPEIMRAQQYRDAGGQGVPPANWKKGDSVAPAITAAQKQQKLAQQKAETKAASTPPPAQTGERSAAANVAKQEVAKAQAQAARTGSTSTGSAYSSQPSTPKPDPNAAYKALQAKAKSASAAGDFKAASAATREAETLGQTQFKAKFGAKYGRRSGMTPNPLMSANPPKSKMTYKGRNPQMDGMPGSTLKNSYEIEGEIVEETKSVFESLKQARKNVGASKCWDGYKAKGTKTKDGRQVPNCVKEEEQLNERPYQVYGYDEEGKKEKKVGKPVKSKRYADARAAELEDTHKKKGGRYRSEYVKEGVRDVDAEKGTEERKKRLEKKRGHSVDDHPQFKKDKKDDSYLETNMKKRQENNEKARKEMAAQKDDTVPRWMKDDFNLYDVILTYLDENGLMDSVEHAEAIMEQLTAEQIESIVEEVLGEAFPPVKGTLNPWESPKTGKSGVKYVTGPDGKPKEIKAPGYKGV